MNITCKCGHKYAAKQVQTPEEQPVFLYCQYEKDGFVCPSCGTDNTPDFTGGARVIANVGVGVLNSRKVFPEVEPEVTEMLENAGFRDIVPPQSISLEEVRERRFSEPEQPAEPEQIMWSATEKVGIGIDNPSRVKTDEEGNTVLMPTSED